MHRIALVTTREKNKAIVEAWTETMDNMRRNREKNLIIAKKIGFPIELFTPLPQCPVGRKDN